MELTGILKTDCSASSVIHSSAECPVGLMHEKVEDLRLIALLTAGFLSVCTLTHQDGDIVICRLSQVYLTKNKVFCFIFFPQKISLAVSKTCVSWNAIGKILIWFSPQISRGELSCVKVIK